MLIKLKISWEIKPTQVSYDSKVKPSIIRIEIQSFLWLFKIHTVKDTHKKQKKTSKKWEFPTYSESIKNSSQFNFLKCMKWQWEFIQHFLHITRRFTSFAEIFFISKIHFIFFLFMCGYTFHLIAKSVLSSQCEYERELIAEMNASLNHSIFIYTSLFIQTENTSWMLIRVHFNGNTQKLLTNFPTYIKIKCENETWEVEE